jgi:hypothetical protein
MVKKIERKTGRKEEGNKKRVNDWRRLMVKQNKKRSKIKKKDGKEQTERE